MGSSCALFCRPLRVTLNCLGTYSYSLLFLHLSARALQQLWLCFPKHALWELKGSVQTPMYNCCPRLVLEDWRCIKPLFFHFAAHHNYFKIKLQNKFKQQSYFIWDVFIIPDCACRKWQATQQADEAQMCSWGCIECCREIYGGLAKDKNSRGTAGDATERRKSCSESQGVVMHCGEIWSHFVMFRLRSVAHLLSKYLQIEGQKIAARCPNQSGLHITNIAMISF